MSPIPRRPSTNDLSFLRCNGGSLGRYALILMVASGGWAVQALGQTTDAPPTADAAPATQAPSQEPSADNPGETPAEPGLALLDSATDLKMSADRMGDLDRVVKLCEEALEKGLGEQNQEFAREMIVATWYEKAKRLIDPALDGNIDGSWGTRRVMAEKALQGAVKHNPEHGESRLLLAQLELLPGGDPVVGKEAADRAIEILVDSPARRSLAYLTRSDYAEKIDDRIADLNQAIELDPKNIDAWRERGYAWMEENKLAEATADLKHVIEADPDDMESLEAMARVLAGQEKYDEALSFANRLKEAIPDSPKPFVLRAGILYLQEKFADALAEASAALEMEPKDLNLLLLRGQMHEALKQYPEALQDVATVLKLRPGLPQALQMRIGIYAATENYAGAIADVRALLENDAQNPALWQQLAALHLADDRPRKAIEEYSRLITLPQPSADLYRGRGDAYLAIGEHAKAIADYDQALTLEPDNEGVLNNLAWVLATSTEDSVRNGARATELAQRACELTDFKAAHILSTLAAGYAEQGNFEKAREWSGKAVEQSDEATRPQLESELKSYVEKKPWREMTRKEDKPEAVPEEQKASGDEFDLSADTGVNSTQDSLSNPEDETSPIDPSDASGSSEEPDESPSASNTTPRIPPDP